jgi:deferrochelatase/peroxidase EfeB
MGSRPAGRGVRFGRRLFLRGAAAGTASLAVALGAGARVATASGPTLAPTIVPFYGEHQAGIATPAQAHLLFASYDLLAGATRADLQRVLQDWTGAAALLTSGETADPASLPRPASAPPDLGSGSPPDPLGLTLTFGLGPRVFSRELGLADRRPRSLVALPRMRREQLDAALSDGDLGVQACADDPSIVFNAIQMLTSRAEGVARLRWMQAGFGATPNVRTSGQTPRNLQGFKDGTGNPLPTDPEFPDIVWVQPQDEPGWLRGGTFLVIRRIRMDLERWNATAVGEQERIIGRTKGTGAPLSGRGEHDPVDLRAAGPDGQLLVPSYAHVRLTNPGENGGQRMLRRGYSYHNPVSYSAADDSGAVDAGLFFMAYVRDPATQFLPMAMQLANFDALNPFITHVGSALFAIPPGAMEGGYVGQSLFA